MARQTQVHRFTMSHPGDVSGLAQAIASGEVAADSIVAIIGKTEGNGGVNDFTRGYFTQSLMHMLGNALGRSPEDLARAIPCVLSGGTEGVLSPHYVVFCRTEAGPDAGGQDRALAVGTAFSAEVPAEDVGRLAQIRGVADAVRAAMRDAGIEDPADVAFVQIKCPCVTSARAQEALARGARVRTEDSSRSMALARAAGAFGIALALGELPDAMAEDALLTDFSVYCGRASVSSGVEITCSEVIVLGNAPGWSGPLRIATRPMRDALDLDAVIAAAGQLGLGAAPQLTPDDRARVAAVFVKCEPDRRGSIRGERHTMLDDTDINAQRHIRGAVGALVAGVIGHGCLFVSGGAEHQGPDGGGLVSIIATSGV